MELFPPKPLHLQAPGHQTVLPLVEDANASLLLPAFMPPDYTGFPLPTARPSLTPRTCSGHRGLPAGKARVPGTQALSPPPLHEHEQGLVDKQPNSWPSEQGWGCIFHALPAPGAPPSSRFTLELTRISLAIVVAQTAFPTHFSLCVPLVRIDLSPFGITNYHPGPSAPPRM